MTETDNEYTPELVVFLGVDYKSKTSAKKRYNYARLADAGDFTQDDIELGRVKVPKSWLRISGAGVVWFGKSMCEFAKAGDIWEVGTTNDGGTWRGNNPLETCRKGAIDHEQVVELQARQRAVDAERHAFKEAKKAQIPVDLETLKPFKEAYSKLTRSQRAVMLANLIEYITR